MVTVEVDPVRVESRLAAGEIECPLCGDAVLAGWGHARARWIDGLEDSPRPRRARCGTCQAMHMLLPVTVLLRKAYVAERIWAALVAPAGGFCTGLESFSGGSTARSGSYWFREFALVRSDADPSWFPLIPCGWCGARVRETESGPSSAVVFGGVPDEVLSRPSVMQATKAIDAVAVKSELLVERDVRESLTEIQGFRTLHRRRAGRTAATAGRPKKTATVDRQPPVSDQPSCNTPRYVLHGEMDGTGRRPRPATWCPAVGRRRPVD